MLRDRNGVPATLFHGVQGSRVLPLDEWIEADQKTAWDGDRRTATKYRSGFHVMQHANDIVRFSNRFRNISDLVICKVWVRGDIWEKEHSPSPILLAAEMQIPSSAWDARLTLTYIRSNYGG